MKLGIFDSGLGGLTVVKALKKLRPDLDIIYLGDTARVPYGDRSPDVIIRYALECARFLNQFQGPQKIDAMIVACNTVSAIAMEALKEIVEVPVYGVLEPGAKAAAKYDRVGLLATRATVDSQAYERTISATRSESRCFSSAAPLLVPLVEEGWTRGNVVSEIAQTALAPLVAEKVQAVILGCTHYPILKPVMEAELQKMNTPVPLIDSGEELAKSLFGPNGSLTLTKFGQGSLQVFTTDGSHENFKRVAETYLAEPLSEILKAEL